MFVEKLVYYVHLASVDDAIPEFVGDEGTHHVEGSHFKLLVVVFSDGDLISQHSVDKGHTDNGR